MSNPGLCRWKCSSPCGILDEKKSGIHTWWPSWMLPPAYGSCHCCHPCPQGTAIWKWSICWSKYTAWQGSWEPINSSPLIRLRIVNQERLQRRSWNSMDWRSWISSCSTHSSIYYLPPTAIQWPLSLMMTHGCSPRNAPSPTPCFSCLSGQLHHPAHIRLQ